MIKDFISRESLEHHVTVYNERKNIENKTNHDNNDTNSNNKSSNNTIEKLSKGKFDTKDIPIEVYVAVIIAIISYFLLK